MIIFVATAEAGLTLQRQSEQQKLKRYEEDIFDSRPCGRHCDNRFR